MPKIYKIHPGIGIGRMGNSLNEFFIGPESPDKPPQELTGNTESPLKNYKDGSGRIKRQAVRFRVYEYEQDAAGNLSDPREITAQDAKIAWSVELANSKGAAPKLVRPDPDTDIPPPTPLRNGNIPAAQLTIAPVFEPISGINQHSVATQNGKFLNKEVFLAELRTDSQGRLIVLGGRGTSASVPPNEALNNFANNPRWHDDASDGPVTAEITFPGQAPRKVDASSWVIFGPPDYAPHIKGITTLYDMAFQGAVTRKWLSAAAKPSFRRDILPILRRASDLRWVNRFDFWDAIPRDWKALSDFSSPATAAANAVLRSEVFKLLMSIRPKTILDDFRFTKVQTKYLEQWRDADFIDDFDSAPGPATEITPENLDRAALENTVGGGFFPGIEAGVKLTYSEIYAEPFRLTRKLYQHFTWNEQLRPGSLTERMAVPWQADFKDCAGNWWPAQRPDEVITQIDEDIPIEEWNRGAEDFEKMIANFGMLGFIVEAKKNGETIYIETERGTIS